MYHYFAAAYDRELRAKRASRTPSRTVKAPPAKPLPRPPAVVSPAIDRPIVAKPIPVEEHPTQPVRLIECPQGCGRQFAEAALKKHVKVCKKVFQDTREVFDSKMQREAEGLEEVASIPSGKTKAATKKKVNWKQQSEAFRLAMMTAKNPDMKLTAEQAEILKGNSDLVNCDYCGRKFNEQTALKHIPFCKQQQLRKGRK